VDLQDGQGIRLLEPDQPITSTPYALAAELARLAEKASVADGVTPGAITAGMIDTNLLADLNRTGGITEITREMLPQDVRDDLNRTITKSMLSQDVLDDLNRTIGVAQLSAEVNEKLNRDFTIQPGSISKSLLGQDVLGDLNRTILRHHLSEELRAELNRTITKSMLAEDIKNDLNRTITLGDLAPEVIADLNDSIQQGSITLDLLSSQVRNDLNRTITKSMLSQEVLNEFNSSSGGGGVVPGSLLAVPANQSAPSGYELYQMGDRKNLVWEEKAPVSVARWAFDGVEVLGGKIYFVGGHDGTAKNIAERYDPATNTWETLVNMSAARRGVACAVLNGKLYAIGGVGLSSVEVFDPSSGNWTVGVALPSEVRNGTAITVNGKIYLIGGKNSSDQNINQVLCFDPSTSQWSTKANMPTARHGMKLVWFENRIWAIGGYDESLTNIVESYDPTSDTWQAEASLTIARNWPVVWVANGRVFVGGGLGGSLLNSIEVYDPATKQWESAGNFPENKFVADAVVLNDKAYVLAGETAGGVWSNKVFAADLNASVSGVFDLYRKDGNASSGVPVAQVANGSITTNQLSEQILKYLKPEITTQPQAQTVFADTNASFSVSAEGKYLTYQWKKNGTALAGETNATLTITDANATQHDGNYTVVVSNDFGSVESGDMEVLITDMILDGLVAWWKFDETSGTVAYDSSGNGHDANLTNGPAWVTGKIGGALSFDGSNDMVRTGVSGMYNQDFTWSTWIKTSDTSGAVVGVSADSWSNGGSSLYILGGKPKIDVCNIGNKLGSLSVNTNQWVHYLLTVEDSGGSSDPVKIFVNGQIDVDSQMNWFGFSGQAFKLRIGHVPIHGNYYLGIIDDVRIYDRVLSNAEVQDLYQLGQ
jgi:N-acetylneuraminic acid mutarotase